MNSDENNAAAQGQTDPSAETQNNPQGEAQVSPASEDSQASPASQAPDDSDASQNQEASEAVQEPGPSQESESSEASQGSGDAPASEDSSHAARRMPNIPLVIPNVGTPNEDGQPASQASSAEAPQAASAEEGQAATQAPSVSDGQAAAQVPPAPAGNATASAARVSTTPVVKGYTGFDSSQYTMPQYTTTPVVNGYSSIDPVVAKKKAGGKGKKVAAITIGTVVAVLLIVYVGVAMFFSSHFLPNTSIGSVNVSMMSTSEAQDAISEIIDDYALTITGQGFTLDLSSYDAGITMDEAEVVKDALSQTNSWTWPLQIVTSHDYSDVMVTSYSDSGLNQAVNDAVNTFNETATQPVNATIAYDSATGGYVIEEEVLGTALDGAKVIAAADEAIKSLNQKVTLTTADLVQPTVVSTDARLTAAVQTANSMVAADVTLMMSTTEAAEINSDLLSQWITLDGDLNVTLDENLLSAWVSDIADQFSTVGTTRTYTRADGNSFTVSGGTYGWEVDEESLLTLVKDAVSAGNEGTIDIPCSSTGAVYDGVGTQDWGSRYIDIDLSAQHVYFYDTDGSLIWESDCVSGDPDGYETSVGVYVINLKQSPSTLNGYENGEKIYETEVTYWMPFDGNAIGLHDASWQSAFGGTRYIDGYGSHGCVNLPVSAAATLYNLVQVGDVVVSHY